LKLGFLYENQMFSFGKPECLVFPENTNLQSIVLNLFLHPKSCPNSLLNLLYPFILAGATYQTMMKNGVSKQDMIMTQVSNTTTNPLRRLWVEKSYPGLIWPFRVLMDQLERKITHMRMWRMRHTFPHPGFLPGLTNLAVSAKIHQNFMDSVHTGFINQWFYCSQIWFFEK
jgi:hypothetical protein